MNAITYIDKGAVLSPGGAYRTRLWRVWDYTRPLMVWVMLNPSTADGEKDDATIRVCVGRAKRMGYGGILVVNLFTLRSTQPKALYTAPDPVGSRADEVILEACNSARVTGGMVVAAWGAHGAFRQRGDAVARLIAEQGQMTLHALLLTADGQPRHPLRIGYDVPLFPWRPAVAGVCRACDGGGHIQGEGSSTNCERCGGTGKVGE